MRGKFNKTHMGVNLGSFLAYPAVNAGKLTEWNLSCHLSIVLQL